MSINEAQFPTAAWDGLSNTRSSRLTDSAPSYEDWDQVTAELIAAHTAILSGVYATGEKGAAAGTGVSAATAPKKVNQTVITLTAASVTVTSAGDGFGFLKIYDFPEGLIGILGAVASLTVARVGTAIDIDADPLVAVGTVACDTNDTSLTSTKANIVPSMTATLSSGSAAFSGVSTAVLIGNGTGTPIDAILNVIVPDADISASSDAVTVTGTITIDWINLGDK